ncbi:hypothetical protein HK101_007658 [Irineochytrium annulatum]|nr:hypothetical protein HK101_007658 [Irineochytrium annulatum]
MLNLKALHASTTPVAVKAVDDERVDERDKGTPDEWVPRHKDLVRLTGRHPFNCEPPLRDLMRQGWITPASLHYVRNHGAVPRIDPNAFVCSVDGLVRNPRSFTMKDIMALKTTSFPVTLVCAGNRRKEQNMIKQSIGFSWGPAGVSNAVWTGVLLTDLIAACGGVLSDKECSLCGEEPAEWVTFEGGDSLPKGVYGTSIRIDTALDPRSDLLVAHGMNGHDLTPDHGRPLRVIIPGHIGGRMVKWLNRITVAPKETTSVYHYLDNRVLPPPVTDSTVAEDGKWWYKPEYIINELNVNSVISSPGHDEAVSLTATRLDDAAASTETLHVPAHPYTLRGYAYAGGGRKITRCEVSFDSGATWQHANVLPYPEPWADARHRRTRHWSWFFWELEVEDLQTALGLNWREKTQRWKLECREICVRAWDASLNSQPEKPTWNLMGMMNNAFFRVRTHLQVTPNFTKGNALTDIISVRFEHPTVPGNGTGGWLKRGESWELPPLVDEDEEDGKSETTVIEGEPGKAEKKAEVEVELDDNMPMYNLEEVSKHASSADCWIVVRGKVYDCTKFLKAHPGGAGSIILAGGTDCTEEFEAIHSVKATAMLKDYYIGRLKAGKNNADEPAQDEADIAASSLPLSPRKYLPFRLVHREELTSDTRLLRFALPGPGSGDGALQPGQHLLLRQRLRHPVTLQPTTVIRAYTPTTSFFPVDGEDNEAPAHFDLVIRVYQNPALLGCSPGERPDPSIACMGMGSRGLDALRVGDAAMFRGPLGDITYLGSGTFKIEGGGLGSSSVEEDGPAVVAAEEVALLAGGTGITPCYQILHAVAAEWRAWLRACGDIADAHTKAEAATRPRPPRVRLLYASRTEDDILLRREMDDARADVNALAADRGIGEVVSVTHALSRMPGHSAKKWDGEVGRIDVGMVKRRLKGGDACSAEKGRGGGNGLAFLCGSEQFVHDTCVKALVEVGYQRDAIFVF